VFDAELKNVLIGFHPLQNDNTVVLEMSEVEKFLNHLDVEYVFANL